MTPDAQHDVRGGEALDDQGRPSSSSYEIFIAVMTLFALAVLVPVIVQQLLGLDGHGFQEIVTLLLVVDLLFCGLFLVDWVRSLLRAPSRGAYLFGERPGRSIPYGILELLGAVPTSFALRFLRLFRLARVGWRPRDLRPARLFGALVETRAESALYVTVLFAFVLVVFGALAMLWFEVDQPGTTFISPTDAVWWALVTITTVGYGDVVPTTEGGRVVAVLTMVGGIALFGVIAGSLARILAPNDDRSWMETTAADPAIAAEIAALRREIAEIRELLESGRRANPD